MQETNFPRYARSAFERRFLVDPGFHWQRHAKPYSKLLQDRYLDCGRLRVRRLEDSDTGRVTFKLTKKFESDSVFAQPVVSISLSLSEYEELVSLPGRDLEKRRHYDEWNGLVFSIDVFSGEQDGLILCETESDSLDALQNASFPQYARWEVTGDWFFTGGSLCRAERNQVNDAMLRTRAVSPVE